MDVILTDRNQVSTLHTCLVPLVAYDERGRALHCVVKYHVLPKLNHCFGYHLVAGHKPCDHLIGMYCVSVVYEP